MHIIYLYQFFSTRKDVGHSRAYEFAKQFVAQGHQVTVITSGAHAQMRQAVEVSMVDGIRVVKLRSGYSNYLTGNVLSHTARLKVFFNFLLRSTLFCLRSQMLHGADVLYVTSPPLTVAVPALLVSWGRQIPLVFEVRDCWPEAPIQLGALRHPFLKWAARTLERLVYRRARYVVALSPGMRDVILATTGIDANKVFVIPNCADLDLFHPDVVGAADMRRELGVSDKFICLYFGAMGEANGLHALLEGCAELERRGADKIIAVLCGAGKERASLEARVQALGLSNVIFTGPFPREALPKLVAAADICLSHFKNVSILMTSSPNKLFDALSAGKPVLDNTDGWIKALLESHKAGLSVSTADPAVFAESLIRLSQAPEQLEELGKNARKLAETEFDRRKQARRLLEILKRAVSQGGQ
jgi:glycosyltransferase involved in cell wall biosynthesis